MVYGISAQVSIGDLFMSGIVPGIMVGIVLMSYCYWYSRKKGWRGQEKVRNARTLMHAAWDAKWALMVPVIVLGGIYGGIMTPTEAAAIAAFYGLIVGLFLYKEMDFKCLINSCIESCETSAVIIVLMAMATLFGNIMTIEDVPGTVARAILSFSENKIDLSALSGFILGHSAHSAPRLFTLAAGLTGLAQDGFGFVLDALALIGFRLADAANASGHFAHEDLVSAHDGELLTFDLRGQSSRQFHENRVGEAHLKFYHITFHSNTVTDADDFEGLGEPFGHALDAVGKEGAAQAVLSAGFARLGLAGQRDVAVGHFIGKKVAHRGGKRSLRSLHFNDISPNLHLDTGGNGDGQFSDSRHATPAYQISHKSSPPTFIW